MKKLILIIIMLSAQNAIADNKFADICIKFPRHPICENCGGGGRGFKLGLTNQCNVFEFGLMNDEAINSTIAKSYAIESFNRAVEEYAPEFISNDIDELFQDVAASIDLDDNESFRDELTRISEISNFENRLSEYFNAMGVVDSNKLALLANGSKTVESECVKDLASRYKLDKLEAKKIVNSLKLFLRK